ncbi:hypothetical protein EW146_g602 [Bondarzewia mesenterica]|uniref:J domain-containing protein n=1 Tax=Bondarzewia mesenterica TaxID=1095465 RepID=A0A4S4M8D6_9AGAM|nr:hypothetical protein EW146_g602 [Bondarzewia mesenterica]
MSSFPDYYSILNVSKTATTEEIRQAYRKESLKTHPDRLVNATPEEKKRATEKFQAVADAYYMLSDSRRRREYDELYRTKSERTSDPDASANFFNMFASMFGNGTGGTAGGAQGRNGQRPNAEGVFGDVFDDLLRPEIERRVPWWSYMGAACGAGIGFIVANIPGGLIGGYAGNRLGAVRDAKGKSVAQVFSELGGNQKAEANSPCTRFESLGFRFVDPASVAHNRPTQVISDRMAKRSTDPPASQSISKATRPSSRAKARRAISVPPSSQRREILEKNVHEERRVIQEDDEEEPTSGARRTGEPRPGVDFEDGPSSHHHPDPIIAVAKTLTTSQLFRTTKSTKRVRSVPQPTASTSAAASISSPVSSKRDPITSQKRKRATSNPSPDLQPPIMIHIRHSQLDMDVNSSGRPTTGLLSPAPSFEVANVPSLVTSTTQPATEHAEKAASASADKSDDGAVVPSSKDKGKGKARELPTPEEISDEPEHDIDLDLPPPSPEPNSSRPAKRRRVEGGDYLGLKMLDDDDSTSMAIGAFDFQMMEMSDLAALPWVPALGESASASDDMSMYVPLGVHDLINSMKHALEIESAARLKAEARYVEEMKRRIALEEQLLQERNLLTVLQEKLRSAASPTHEPGSVQSSSAVVEAMLTVSNESELPEPSASAVPQSETQAEQTETRAESQTLPEHHEGLDMDAAGSPANANASTSSDRQFNKFWSFEGQLVP